MRNLNNTAFVVVALSFASMLFASAAHAIVIGQLDDFEDATLQNWGNGTGPGVVNAPTGGPAGAGDNFLEVTSGVSVPRLVVFNRTQWLGDYITAGVTAIEMDLKILAGGPPLPMRLVVRESNIGASSPAYASLNPFMLPNDSQWHHVIFQLDGSSMTPLNSPSALNTVLASPFELRILSSALPSTIGDSISAVIGIDNIHAIPEPGALSGFVLVATAAIARRRRNSSAASILSGSISFLNA